jgi:ElaB/YqjD/DUF883 family membrane-anchored ribosome-binding protein
MDQIRDQAKPKTGYSSEHESSDPMKVATNRGKEATTAGKDTGERGQDEIAALREDLSNLKETVTKIISAATHDVASSARDVTSNLAGRVNTAAGELADKGRDAVSATTDHAKNIMNEFESMARRNPIGTLAGAVVVGVMIGMMGRRN